MFWEQLKVCVYRHLGWDNVIKVGHRKYMGFIWNITSWYTHGRNCHINVDSARRHFQLKMIYHGTHMGGPRPFSHSEMSFVLRSDLVNHMKIRTRERTNQCTHFEKVFAWEGTLVMYIKIHTGEKTTPLQSLWEGLWQKNLILQSI